MKKLIILLTLCLSFNFLKAQWSTPNPHIYYNGGNVGIGTSTPSQLLDVRGHIYTTGSVFIDGGDLVLKRTSYAYGYVARPNIPGYKKLQFAVEGGGPLEELYVNSDQSIFGGKVNIGDAYDGTPYGFLQLARPANQGDNKFHLSFIRGGNSVFGMGYAPNSNVFGIWHANNNGGTPALAFTPEQNVGIGTLSPSTLLQVHNNNVPANTVGSVSEVANFSGTVGNILQMKFLFRRHTLDGGWTNISSRLQAVTDITNQGYLEFNPEGEPYGLALGTGTTELMRFMQNGNIGIGTTDTKGYRFAVNGSAIFTKAVVKLYANWGDYVFEKDYHLPSLQEIEQFIQTHKHLPEMPSAAEVEKNGLDLGDNQALVVKKIEELTLYIIQQQKEIEKLKSENKIINELKNEINAIKEKFNESK